MRLKEHILSLFLLTLIFVGGGGVLSQYLLTCDAHNQQQHHTCCCCKHHAAECDSHSSAYDHDCPFSKAISLEYISVRGERLEELKCVVSFLIICQEFNEFKLPIYSSIAKRFKPWLDDELIDRYDPSAALLRAPPARV